MTTNQLKLAFISILAFYLDLLANNAHMVLQTLLFVETAQISLSFCKSVIFCVVHRCVCVLLTTVNYALLLYSFL